MRAPVYRHIESDSTVAGLTLHELVFVLGLAFLATATLSFVGSLLAILIAYVALRLLRRGRPPMYWQHAVIWHLRRLRYRGWLSSTARSRTPAFPANL
jgi:hypothetical protein